MGSDKIYIAIDLKSFYASVEAVDLGLDPLTANLVVADPSRTEKTICLAVSPSLKAYGISGRARLFEVVQKVKQANSLRRSGLPQRKFTGRSCDAKMLERDPRLEIDYVIAPPQMAHYMEVSTKIYHIYLKYVAPEDIHVYSIDEVFMDVTEYLGTYRMTARELAMKMIQDVLSEQRSLPLRGSPLICTFARLPWTLWQNMWLRIRTECGSQSWMKCLIARCYGITGRLRISGE